MVDYTKNMENLPPSPLFCLAKTQDKSFRLAFFSALCLFLSMVEYAIPKPLPFLRLGLANLPILLAFSKLAGKNIVLLVLIKSLAQGLVSGTLFSYVFLFSVAGSSAAACGMAVVYFCLVKNRKKPGASLVGMSLAGALCNNGAQLLVARFVIFGAAARYIAPVLLASGLLTGVALGFFAQFFVSKSLWYSSLEQQP